MLLLSANSLMAQEWEGDPTKVLYKGQLHVSRVKVYSEGDFIYLHMRFNYSSDLLNRGEKLYVSPQFRNGNEKMTLAPMVFDGKSKKWRVRGVEVIVIADEANGQLNFDIEYKSRYYDWLQGSSLCFASEEILNNKVRNHYLDSPFPELLIEERVSANDKMASLVPNPNQVDAKVAQKEARAAAKEEAKANREATKAAQAAEKAQAEADEACAKAEKKAAQLQAKAQSAAAKAASKRSEPVLDASARANLEVAKALEAAANSSKTVKTPKVKKTKLSNGSPHDTSGLIHLRTNLLYDAVLLPNIGMELGLSPRYSLVLNAGGNWLKFDSKHWYWRILSADIEGRYWLGNRSFDGNLQHQGHHVGVYGAVYRYDLEFGHKGQMGNFAYGGGISYGYSVPIGRRLSLDMSLGVGYIGGKYKEYEPQDDCYVWLADKQRHYFGPTKAEVTLVWHIGTPGMHTGNRSLIWFNK